MTRRPLGHLASLVLTAIAACGAILGAQQAPDRSTAPRPGPAPAFTPPPVVRRALQNGLPVWIVEMHKVPVVHVSLVIRAGSGADPAGKFGVASFAADMLDEGAANRSALEIADAVDFLGATLSTASSFDSSAIALHVPAARLAQGLEIMADVALRPTFPDREIQRVREELLTSLIQAQDDPAALAQIAFPRLVYGPTHRYGTLDIGTAASLKGFTTADLRAFHDRYYVPSNAALIVAGDVAPAALMPVLESAFGAWTGEPAAPAAVPAAPQLRARQVYLIDKPGAAQSQISIGWVGVPRSTPDYFALRVLNTILGGAFTSRLNTNLREEHGYAYGAGSSFDMRLSAGPFSAAAGVQTDKTAESIREFFNELQEIRKPVPPGELEKAESFLSLLLPRSFETTASVAGTLAQAFVYSLPDEYFSTYSRHVAAVTAADVERAATTYIQPDKFAVVVVGDRSVIEAGIRTLNLGPIRVVTVDEIMK